MTGEELRGFIREPSWLKVKWAILRYVAGDSPVVLNMEFVQHPVLEFNGPSHGALISNVTITQMGSGAGEGPNRAADLQGGARRNPWMPEA